MPEGFPLWISVWPTATEEAQLQSFLSPSLNPVMQSFSFPDHTHSHALPQGVTAHLRASLTNHRSNPAFWNICSLLWFSLFPCPESSLTLEGCYGTSKNMGIKRARESESWAEQRVLPMTSEKLSINSHGDSSHPSAISGYGITLCVWDECETVKVCGLTMCLHAAIIKAYCKMSHEFKTTLSAKCSVNNSFLSFWLTTIVCCSCYSTQHTSNGHCWATQERQLHRHLILEILSLWRPNYWLFLSTPQC